MILIGPIVHVPGWLAALATLLSSAVVLGLLLTGIATGATAALVLLMSAWLKIGRK